MEPKPRKVPAPGMTTQLQTRCGVKYFRCVGSQLLLFDIFHGACENVKDAHKALHNQSGGGRGWNRERFSFLVFRTKTTML